MRKILVIILGILLIVGSIFLIARPGVAFSMLGYFMALALLVNGIASIITWFKLKDTIKPSVWHLVSAIISIIFAISVFSDVFFKFAAEIVLMYMVAFWFLITGIMRIVMSFNMKKDGFDKWWVFLILGILLVICGIMSIANPVVLMFAIGLNLAINMMFCGVDLITLSAVF